MIEWLFEQTLMMTLLLLVVLSAQKLTSKTLSARARYTLWLTLPLALIINTLLGGQSASVIPQQYIVSVALPEVVMQPIFNLDDLLLYAWLTGSLILFALVAFQHSNSMRRLNLRARKPHEIEGFNAVMYTAYQISPFVTGIIRPKLILPEDFEQAYSATQQRLIVQHEKTHMQHGDLWWNSLAYLLLLAFWFNPFCWIAYRYYRQAQELACDEAVLSGQQRCLIADYANALLQARQQSASPIATIHYGDKKIMKNRITSLLNVSKSKPFRLGTSIGLALIVALSTTLVTAGPAAENSVVIQPQERIEPLYPLQAAKQNIEGSVVLQFDIETDGSVSNVRIVEATPERVFENNAKTALRQWKYKPVPEKVTDVVIQLDFVLDQQGMQSAIDNHKGENEMIPVQKRS